MWFRFLVVSVMASLVIGHYTVCHDGEESLNLFKSPECRSLDFPGNQSCDGCGVPLYSEINVEDIKAGIINVEFGLYPACCKYQRYELILKVKNHETNKSCSPSDEYVIHSKRSLKIYRTTKNNNAVSCEQKEIVTFTNIYTGCYSLVIDSHRYPRMKRETPHYKFIETNYKKFEIVNKIPVITPQIAFNCERIDFEFSISRLHELNVKLLEIEYRRCNEMSLNCGMCYFIDSWKIGIDWNKFVWPVCGKTAVIGTINTQCILNEDILECGVQNITGGGFYCVIVSFLDDRCKGGTTWTKKGDTCTYFSALVNATVGLCTVRAISSLTNNIPIIVGAGIGVLLALSIYLGIIIYRKRSPPHKGEYQYKICETKRPQLLLLYPYDCKEFMDLMTSFRIQLEEYTTCEVFDCFDELHAEYIAKNKSDWIRKHIMNTEEKIIVVETQCAVLHQKALKNNCKITYTKPHWLDYLFVTALKILTEDITNNTYERVFVVRIEGFTGHRDMLKHITPFTRYVIPQHLGVLVSQLYQNKNEHSVILYNDTENKLVKMIEVLARYKTDNPKYLKQFAQITVC